MTSLFDDYQADIMHPGLPDTHISFHIICNLSFHHSFSIRLRLLLCPSFCLEVLTTFLF